MYLIVPTLLLVSLHHPRREIGQRTNAHRCLDTVRNSEQAHQISQKTVLKSSQKSTLSWLITHICGPKKELIVGAKRQ
jgi:hypothetical protein